MTAIIYRDRRTLEGAATVAFEGVLDAILYDMPKYTPGDVARTLHDMDALGCEYKAALILAARDPLPASRALVPINNKPQWDDEFIEIAIAAAEALRKPKEIIGRRTTRDLRSLGRRAIARARKLYCRVADDGVIRAFYR